MTDVLAHRGPDDEGTYRDEGVGLGVRRLSILDVEGGHQPISNETGSAWVVLNGEIYNYPELRHRLERTHRLTTHTDTEIIVHLYEEYGDACVHALRGMFAFAVWDAPRRRLLIARDRLGEKPLYYWHGSDELVFGSEIKALLKHPSVPREVDRDALQLYLALGYVPDPWTMLAGIRKLPPGHTLVWENHDLTVRRYWDLTYLDPPRKVGLEEAAEEVRRRVDEATRMRLLADVPVGALLSGGLDSSAIVAGMAKRGAVNTFTVGFDVGGYSEFAEARAVAERYETQHREEVVRVSGVAELLPKIVWHMDEPIADPAALPTYLISQFARRSVTVVLTGEGGDEIFGGYPRYGWFGVSKRLQGLPTWLRATAARAAAGTLSETRGHAHKAALLLDELTDEERHLRWVGIFNRSQREGLLGDVGSSRLPEQVVGGYLGQDTPSALTHRLMYLDLKTWLSGDLLMKVDRMTMGVGLEARAPFLDHELVEFVATLPAGLKVGRGGTKPLLRAAYADLPAVTTRRGKHPFAVPVTEWFRTGLREYVTDKLTATNASIGRFLHPEAVRSMVEDHASSRANHGRGLWTLLCLELWLEMFIDAPAP